MEKFDLHLKGISCASCAKSVESILAAQQAEDVSIDVISSKVHFSIADSTKLGTILAALRRGGFPAMDPHEEDSVSKAELALALCCTLPFLAMMVPFLQLHLNGTTQIILSAPVLLIGIKHFWRAAVSSLKALSPSMEVLVLIGATSAFIYSLILHFVFHTDAHGLYFETTATIVTIVLFGNLLEASALRRSGKDIEDVASLLPAEAQKIGPDGKSVAISVDLLAVGDQVIVSEGSRVPADGTILSGSCQIDEAIMTGESLPVERKSGDAVLGGTLVVSGNAVVKVTTPADQAFCNKVLAMCEGARARKPSIQRIGDRVSAVFVPLVVFIALGGIPLNYFFLDTSLGEALMRSISVLVVACPCAMGLATPAAVAMALGLGAKKGIIFKGGDAIEKLARSTLVVFDKTGTLTTGAFTVTTITNHSTESAETINAFITALAKFSAHPLCKPLKNLATAASLSEITEERGLGMKGKSSCGETYTLGSLRTIQNPPANLSGNLFLAKNGALLASVALADEPRLGAVDLLSNLRRDGKKVIILSGDAKSRVEQFAKDVGGVPFLAEQTPEQKLNFIKEQVKGEKVAYVGDGINDAPALSLADVGISFVGATDLAQASAQVLITTEDARAVYQAQTLSQRTVRVIKQNLFWAFLYNVCMIPLAVVGTFSPTLAALSMLGSDVVIIINSIRLR